VTISERIQIWRKDAAFHRSQRAYRRPVRRMLPITLLRRQGKLLPHHDHLERNEGRCATSLPRSLIPRLPIPETESPAAKRLAGTF
jgi:hypothetical protein